MAAARLFFSDFMHTYRTHHCGQLRDSNVDDVVRLSGWVHKKRDHGGIVFIDLRDHYGVTQLVLTPSNPHHQVASDVSRESVITVTGRVVRRSAETINSALPTGEIEIQVDDFVVDSPAAPLPFLIAEEQETPEATRLTYRFLDLRRQRMHEKVLLRAQIIASMRRRMIDLGFVEFQTPILTSSSPEGARDYLVPSRLHPGKFYALPQAPQQFKQLLMVSGFDRYFQIAPCFRDEDARADRSPGEFYQLDLEMSFVEQDDVFEAVEHLMHGLFNEFSSSKISDVPFRRIPYKESMLKYGNDKPDLRFELEIQDVSGVFAESSFRIFRGIVEKGGVVRMLAVPNVADRPRSFFDGLDRFVKEQGGKGLAYLILAADGTRGSIASALDEATLGRLKELPGAETGSALLFIADQADGAAQMAGRVRVHMADLLDLREKDAFRFCWITDYPMYERNDETGEVQFSHNPFSMPQGGLDALENQEPLDILAYQYDLVCNGVELSSGAIRNHRPDIMYKAFEIAGYDHSVVDERFGAMIAAFKYGAPPHGGIAPGVDRIVMLLAGEPNIREVIAFPMSQNGQDLMMGAPGQVQPEQLEILGLKIVKPIIRRGKPS